MQAARLQLAEETWDWTGKQRMRVPVSTGLRLESPLRAVLALPERTDVFQVPCHARKNSVASLFLSKRRWIGRSQGVAGGRADRPESATLLGRPGAREA